MKASTLIRDVVADAARLDRNKYHPSARFWHQECQGNLRCSLCFAGVWLTRNLEPTQTVDLNTLTSKDCNIIRFLDAIRTSDYDEIDLMASRAGLDLPHMIQRTLQAMKYNTLKDIDDARDWPPWFKVDEITETIPEKIFNYFNFVDWRTFDNFLEGVAALADILESKGL